MNKEMGRTSLVANTSEPWEAFLAGHPEAHLLQTAQWGELKSSFGWQVERVVQDGSGAQILFRNLPLGFSFAYLPKGPVGPGSPGFWHQVDRICKQHRAVFLKIEPDAWEDDPMEKLALPAEQDPTQTIRSPHSVQPRRTIVIRLDAEEEKVLAQMHQKTRYNLRLALKKDVTVHASGDVDAFNRLMEVTGERDAFGVHSPAYYRQAYELFHGRGACELFLAEYDHQPIAGLMVFARGKRAWYFYGASDNAHRNRMPNYLLQWEAMRWARQQGCTSYDLWGIPDEPANVLEETFTERNDGLWGVYRFKRGFGGEIRRSAPAYDRVYHPLLYRLYLQTLRYRGRVGTE